jgi:hypothetical protein
LQVGFKIIILSPCFYKGNFRNKELFAEESVKIFEIGHVFSENGESVLLGIANRFVTKKTKSKPKKYPPRR